MNQYNIENVLKLIESTIEEISAAMLDNPDNTSNFKQIIIKKLILELKKVWEKNGGSTKGFERYIQNNKGYTDAIVEINKPAVKKIKDFKSILTSQDKEKFIVQEISNKLKLALLVEQENFLEHLRIDFMNNNKLKDLLLSFGDSQTTTANLNDLFDIAQGQKSKKLSSGLFTPQVIKSLEQFATFMAKNSSNPKIFNQLSADLKIYFHYKLNKDFHFF